LAVEGARLVLHYHRHGAPIRRLQAELGPDRAWPLRADLRREAECRRLMQSARRRFGRLDTLVVNAGIWVARARPLVSMSLRQWQRTLDTNLTAAFLCCREFARVVQRQRRGNIVLVGSTAALFGEAGHADYAVSKAGLVYGLTRTLKNELARLAPHTRDYCGGRVNCVCPGWTLTPMTHGHLRNQKAVRRAMGTMALPQLARPEDIARAIVFLASDTLARHVTGHILTVAGGMEGRQLWDAGEIDLDAL